MNTVAIPEWTPQGVLPPVDPANPASPQRSPYPVALMDLVMRFATSVERRTILSGLLNYRAALHATGLVSGVQWLDGSFLEQIETLERRAPRDIDVVSFVHTPPGFAPTPEQWALLEHDAAKAQFHVDSYFVELDALSPKDLVAQSTYWYSMWSHRRTQSWKGYLQIDLAPTADALAQAWLDQQDPEEAKP